MAAHINNVNRRHSYRSAPEQPDRCLGNRGECWRTAVGYVIFNSSAYQFRLPIHVPLAVCEQHYIGLELLKSNPKVTIIRELERYNP